MSTAAIRFLEEAGVEFETYDYEVDEAVGEGYGEAVALAIGAEPERVFKTLLAEIDGSHVVVAIIPVSQRLSTKALARVAGGLAGGPVGCGSSHRLPARRDQPVRAAAVAPDVRR